ncbi:hypothetical protein [Methylotuvimicrobium buryatense]|uniref:Uncharacterized protein n=1 Tax=Methylotuvimicrobium buryatense TaxID=95641 RepID=A0A4P9UR95_METBY|nr:hypothetical protein [Methylotuvimicrobium buryatense]QCW83988.1 hypothetical protein EQU24_18370 [Methylotuvimicrobium buryatense]
MSTISLLHNLIKRALPELHRTRLKTLMATVEAGLGFPILRLEIVASLNHGGLLGAEVAPYCGKGTGETALLRRLMATTVQPHDICLMDQYYDNLCCYPSSSLGNLFRKL